MKRNCILGALFVSLMLYSTTALGAVPHLIKSIPADGATNVLLQQGKIVLFFDQNMKMGSWSLMQSGVHPFPPLLPIEEPWIDPLTFEFEIKSLKPDTVYAIQLNGKKRKGFMASDDQSSLPITTITFTTAPDASQGSATVTEKAQKEPSIPPPVQPQASNNQQTGKQIQINPGWRINVTRSIGMEGTETYQTGYQAPFRIFQKIVFIDEVAKADGNNIQESMREIKSAQLHSLDLESGKMVKQDLASPGTRFRVSYTSYGSTLFDGATGQQIWDTDMVATFAPPLIPKLWPNGVLQAGQKWSYQDADLISRIGLLDVLGGKIDLRVESIKQEPSTGLAMAAIRGRLKTKVDLDDVVLDFDAEVEIDLPLELGVPFMVKFDGRLSGGGVAEDENGQPINYQIQAKGTLLQIAKPSNAIIESVGGKPIENKINTQGALRVPLSNAGGTAPQGTGGLHSGTKEAPGGVAHSQSGKSSPVYRYRLYEDTTEQAFTVLVPEGWQTEGGIMQFPPNQVRTVVDGCGKKLYFSIFDPSSQAAITYFPTEMYHTSAPGTSMINLAPGQVLNGMMQMPQLLTPSQYVRQLVFPFSRPNVSNVEWGKLKNLTTLANAWNRAFHSEDRVPPQIRAESIEVAYDRSSTRFAELWTALITSTSVNTSTIWLPDFAVVAGAPINSVEEIAPVLKAVITSFRINPTWMAKTIVKFNACVEGVAVEQEKIRAIDRKISKRLMQVQKEIHKIDNEIVANRDATRSVIQEHEHNTLMGEDKYEDTETRKIYTIDVGYERNFTNGEQIIQTNDWNFKMPVGFRDMNNINITDE